MLVRVALVIDTSSARGGAQSTVSSAKSVRWVEPSEHPNSSSPQHLSHSGQERRGTWDSREEATTSGSALTDAHVVTLHLALERLHSVLGALCANLSGVSEPSGISAELKFSVLHRIAALLRMHAVPGMGPVPPSSVHLLALESARMVIRAASQHLPPRESTAVLYALFAAPPVEQQTKQFHSRHSHELEQATSTSLGALAGYYMEQHVPIGGGEMGESSGGTELRSEVHTEGLPPPRG